MARQSLQPFFDEPFLARLQQLHLIAKRLAWRHSPGPRRSRRVGDGLEFADHRSYSPGDDIRFIDWPYYARMERLLLRLFHEHSESDVAILLDCSASMAGGNPSKFNYARRTAAALAYVAMGSMERVIVLPFNSDLGPALHTGRNRGQIFNVMEFLARCEPGGKTDLGRCVDRFARQYPSAGTAIVLSDLQDSADALDDSLARLGMGGRDVNVLHVFSPDDASPQLDGAVLLEQAETRQHLGVNVTEELLASYRQCWGNFQNTCQRACVSHGATYVPADTSMPFDRLVLQSLRQAGVLG